MKNLRQLLQRTGWIKSDKRHRARPKQERRQLTTQMLERRELLAGDLLGSGSAPNPNHNYWHALDATQDRVITARDALVIMNHQAKVAVGEDVGGSEFKLDTNNDGRISSADALVVINGLASGEEVGELAELLLTARDMDDNLLATDSSGNVLVDVGQRFKVEIAYNDLRTFGGDIGAFQVFADVIASTGSGVVEGANNASPVLITSTAHGLNTGDTVFIEGAIGNGEIGTDPLKLNGVHTVTVVGPDTFTLDGVDATTTETYNPNSGARWTRTPGTLKPVLNETQRLIFDEAIRTATSGTYLFSLEGSSATYTSTLNAFGGNPTAEMNNALAAFGYTPDQYELTKQDTGDGKIRFLIEYSDLNFGNIDLPDISVADNFDVSAPVTFTEIAPFLADDFTPNSDAVRFNLDTRSRTFDNNTEFYNSLNAGAYQMFSGFDEVGGTGGIPNNGGGIPELASNNLFIEPFDVLSLWVFFDAAGTVDVSVNPGEGDEAFLLYGDNDPVPQDMILVDEDATVTFIVGGTGNTAPVPGPAIVRTFDERDALANIDLLANASDADGDQLTIRNFVQTNAADASGISLNGSILTVDPAAYVALNTGQSVAPTFSFEVFDGTAAVGNTATITINGFTENTPPTSTDVSATFNEDQVGGFAVDLLQNASDVDGDPLSATAVLSASNTGNAGGITIDNANNQLLVTPSFYGFLNDGQSEVVTYDVTISDGNGGTVPITATVTITGITDNADLGGPVLGTSPLTVTITEDDSNSSFDLRTDASDPDNDTLTVINLSLRTGGDARGITPVGNFLNFTPNSYNDLAATDSVQAVYDYQITDGNNPAVAQVVTVTINGVNDAPTVSNTVSATFNEDDNPGSVNLLQFANDVDGDTLTVTNVVNTAGNDVGITTNGNSLSVTPAAYSDLLNQGQNEVVTFTYTIIDGNGGTVNSSATVTIIGEDEVIPNRDPVLGTSPLTATFSEDDSTATLNLLLDASDPDGDTLSFGALSNTPAGVTVNNGVVTFNPNAYNSLSGGSSTQVSFTYPITDGNGGSAQQSFTITVNGVNDTPTVSNSISRTFVETDADTSFSLLQFAADPDSGDTLTVTNQSVISGDGKGVMVVGNSLAVSPGAYADDLDSGQSETIVVAFNLIDGNGGSVAQTATVVINGIGPFPPTDVSGTLFIDERSGGVRNGQRDSGESGLSGIRVHLRSTAANNSTGQNIHLTTLTDAHGDYVFVGVQPGTYEVEYELPSQVVFVGSNTMTMVVDPTNGSTLPMNFAALGLSGSLSSIDILASTHLNTNGQVSDSSKAGVEGGSVKLGADGVQEMIVLGEGFEDVDFVEFVLNAAKDAGAITKVVDGVRSTALVSKDRFVIGADGCSVRFFGGLDDFVFDDSSLSEFPALGTAVDEYFDTLGQQ